MSLDAERTCFIERIMSFPPVVILLTTEYIILNFVTAVKNYFRYLARADTLFHQEHLW